MTDSGESCARCQAGTMGRLEEIYELFVWTTDDTAPRYLAYQPIRQVTVWKRLTQPQGQLVGKPALDICMRCGHVEMTVSDAAVVSWEEVEHAAVIEDGSRCCATCAGQRMVVLDQVFTDEVRLQIARVKVRVLAVTMAQPVGDVGATICRQCGHADLHVGDPAGMPWDDLLEFEWLGDERRCLRCGDGRVGYLTHAGDRDATIARLKAPRGSRGSGQIEAVVCARCGYLDLAVKNPGAVAWDRWRAFTHR